MEKDMPFNISMKAGIVKLISNRVDSRAKNVIGVEGPLVIKEPLH